MVVLTVLAWSVAGLAALVLFVPLSARAEGAAGDDELHGMAELRWGGGVVAFRLDSEQGAWLRVLGWPLTRLEGFVPSAKDEEKKKEKWPKVSRQRVGRLLGADRRAVQRMLIDGIRAFHPHVYIGGTIGFQDPGDTAIVCALRHRLNGVVAQRLRLDIHDDFLTDRIQLVGRLRVWVVPAHLVALFGGWVLRTETRRVLRGAS